MQIGRRIYYDVLTGKVLVDTGEQQGAVSSTTIDQDISTYLELKQRVRSTFGVLELSFGQYAEEFRKSTSYRVNLTTKRLEFSVGTPEEPTLPPVYQVPLSERVEELEASWMYDSMMKDLAIEEANATQADLMYQLMLKGVL